MTIATFLYAREVPKELSLTASIIIIIVQKVNNIHAQVSKCLQLDFPFRAVVLESSTFTRVQLCKSLIMATRRVLSVDEVVEELQNSDSENDDDSEDDFDGYLDEEEMQQRWMGEMAMEGNSDLEGNGSEREESNSVED